MNVWRLKTRSNFAPLLFHTASLSFHNSCFICISPQHYDLYSYNSSSHQTTHDVIAPVISTVCDSIAPSHCEAADVVPLSCHSSPVCPCSLHPSLPVASVPALGHQSITQSNWITNFVGQGRARGSGWMARVGHVTSADEWSGWRTGWTEPSVVDLVWRGFVVQNIHSQQKTSI